MTFFPHNFIQLTLTAGSLLDTVPLQQLQCPKVSSKNKYINFYRKQSTSVFAQIQYPLFPSSGNIIYLFF